MSGSSACPDPLTVDPAPVTPRSRSRLYGQTAPPTVPKYSPVKWRPKPSSAGGAPPARAAKIAICRRYACCAAVAQPALARVCGSRVQASGVDPVSHRRIPRRFSYEVYRWACFDIHTWFAAPCTRLKANSSSPAGSWKCPTTWESATAGCVSIWTLTYAQSGGGRQRSPFQSRIRCRLGEHPKRRRRWHGDHDDAGGRRLRSPRDRCTRRVRGADRRVGGRENAAALRA